MAKAKWLYNRGGTYYFRAVIRGEIVQRVIGKVSKAFAEKVARDWYQKALEQKLTETLGETNRGVSTVAELLEAYAEAAERRGEPKPVTVRNNRSSLLGIIRKVTGKTDEQVLAMPLSVLSEDLVKDYVREMLKSTDDEQRTRRTIASTLTQARSILSNKMRDEYKRMNIPACVAEFRTVYAGKREKKRYRLPPRELRDRTALEAAALRTTDPDLYLVYLLCFHLGMRAKEAAHVRWGWFEEQAGRIFVHIMDRPDEAFGCKGNEGTVPVPLKVWSELKAMCHNAPFILPGASKTDRYNLVEKRFSAWMRSIGWDANTYPKAAHELRKLIGSMWYKAYGSDGARVRLRHAEIQTTLDHYAHLDYTDMQALEEVSV